MAGGGQSRSLKDKTRGKSDEPISFEVPSSMKGKGLDAPVKKGQSPIDAAFPDFDPVKENKKAMNRVSTKPESTYDTIKNRGRNIDTLLNKMEKGED